MSNIKNLNLKIIYKPIIANVNKRTEEERDIGAPIA